MDDKKATQIFEIRNILTNYCGQLLSPDKIDEIMNIVIKEITEGHCSWAFK